MSIQLHDSLKIAEKKNALPNVIAYNRIDGPGSSLDLSEFQQTFWKLPKIPQNDDPARKWTCNLPRTVGITIDTGTKIEARPFDPDLIGVKSVEYKTEVTAFPGEVIPVKENWLLKIIEIFDIKGVMFVLENLREGIQSSGLGGSSTATIGVCILANELAGRPFSKIQLISLASRIEQGFGVSITGTQEQSNVIFGGVTDYVWFPWGIPGHPGTGYGDSLRYELMPPEDYGLLEERTAIFHTGRPRQSSDVNLAWRNALLTEVGYKLHSKKMKVAYKFREGLRLQKWDHVTESIDEYRRIRTKLCEGYMESSRDLLERAKVFNCIAFPLGAGGGGGVLLFSKDPESLEKLREDLKGIYSEIPFKIRSMGHEINNVNLGK
ncbi:MAG: GHMP kinase [Methanobacterium sp.]|uniref:GHMP family kinase ATP-binding protein n=1 Tax=Methanobacterium sp. TaxID=2164 RepID=UPI003D65272F|nr:GHMP kinase [Methanobacterium sp.]